ncbi:MAG: nucleotidyl transferase AbiEii/AbiGii toxin family protein, partial [Caldiserica bacterium]|nr:nucleotidyl transferase AbiEii/AbiGii toxin family protein [Caldisericota bacterium]
GTALKKMYFPDYRFSEDLDFLINQKESFEKYERNLDMILAQIGADYPFQPGRYAKVDRARLQIFITYDVVPEIKAVKNLKVDILQDRFFPSFARKKILFTYSDFSAEDIKMNTYTLESMVSDKISRILEGDREARDIYDLWSLLKLELDISKVKLEFKKRFGYGLYLPNLLNRIEAHAYKKIWKVRLERQIQDLPAYDDVLQELKRLLVRKFRS